MGLGAALERERLGDDRAGSCRSSIQPRSGSIQSSSEPNSSHSVSMFRPITAFESLDIFSGWKIGVVATIFAIALKSRFSPGVTDDAP